MTAQPIHSSEPFIPPMKTFGELREALAIWGLPGDLERFNAELDDVDLDDITKVREITQAYRHRVILRQTPEAMAALTVPTDDFEAQLRRKLEEVGG
ncbi:hypothetical protein KV557_24630 [Kitasatospora aureofaciens]|uniref:hypothetical protein n=1 Tax=Kitasatospora aureofaciens TaxID=1894 RepID=UPI001C441A05|nr:hypothetical protein [Kitasatospora aureofaciens]MBV6700251.1 hypothetical protein [Kitasatospora aureofaciens]